MCHTIIQHCQSNCCIVLCHLHICASLPSWAFLMWQRNHETAQSTLKDVISDPRSLDRWTAYFQTSPSHSSSMWRMDICSWESAVNCKLWFDISFYKKPRWLTLHLFLIYFRQGTVECEKLKSLPVDNQVEIIFRGLHGKFKNGTVSLLNVYVLCVVIVYWSNRYLKNQIVHA